MSLILLSFILSLSLLPTPKGQQPDANGTIWCGPFADTSIPCPNENEPVCAPYPRYCVGTPCPQVMEFYNGCVACQDPTVTGYTMGRCVYTCATAELDQSNKVVCAIYQEGCQDSSCRREFQNSWTACQDPSVVSFTIEYCPTNNTEGSAEAEIIGIESTAPISETPVAEEQTNEVSVIPGEEQENSALGIHECPVVFVSETAACTEQYEPVCAYHFDCTGETCQGVTVGNSCQACSEFGYDYYLDGACEMGANDYEAVNRLATELLEESVESVPPQ